jgi:hypothetical protein
MPAVGGTSSPPLQVQVILKPSINSANFVLSILIYKLSTPYLEEPGIKKDIRIL